MKLLENLGVIVTGGASPRGIGRAAAVAAAAEGARVAILDLRADEAEAAARDIGPDPSGLGHRGFACDVGDRAACARSVAAVAEAFGRIDCLMTFAGISRSTRLLDITEEEYEAVLRINLGGTMNMCQAAVPYMKAGASIVCIGSVAGQRGGGLFGTAHYAASKGGVHSLAKALARELGPQGIRVNAIAPGLIDTDIFQGKLTDAMKQQILATIPLNRVGQPRDVADLAVFLASDRASFITGAVIDVNGGSHIH